MDILETAEGKFSNSKELKLQKAFLYGKYGKVNTALGLIEELKQEYPNDPRPLSIEANLYFLKGDYEKAEMSIKWAISLQENSPYYHNNLSLLYEKMADASLKAGNKEQARGYLTDAEKSIQKALSLKSFPQMLETQKKNPGEYFRTLMEKQKVGFYTLGCRLNQYESDGLAKTFRDLGLETVAAESHPEFIVVNTCTVTNRADSKNRNIIRNAIKMNPGSRVFVTGCYAETDREILEKIPGVAGVFGNSEKSSLPYKILDMSHTEIPTPGTDRFSYTDVLPVGHTRAYLKIQDGCNRVCSYCKIPSARGKGVSRKESEILDQVRFLQDGGVGEIVLTGVNLGWFKNESGEKGFIRLLEKILGILEYSRLRISSIEPSDVNKSLSTLLKHPRFCKFLHVPLQSGDSGILKRMKRSYTAETFRKRLEIIRSDHPEIFLGTDLIVGFPGEGESEFRNSLELIETLQIAKIHAFPYSPRKGTPAENFPDSLNGNVKKERVRLCNQISNKNMDNYFLSQEGKILEGILEQDGRVLTDNYLHIRLESGEREKLIPGQFVNVKPGKILKGEKKEYLGTLAMG